jgi:hypothetical protein
VARGRDMSDGSDLSAQSDTWPRRSVARGGSVGCGVDAIHNLAAVAIVSRRYAAGYGLKAALRTTCRWSRAGPRGACDRLSALGGQEGT